MSRMSRDTLEQGFDYVVQVWYQNGRYVRCGHPESMRNCCNAIRLEGQVVAYDNIKDTVSL